MLKTRRKKGPVVSKKVMVDGIQFASGLERYMYLALKKAGIKAEYEGESFELMPSFHFYDDCYERQSNGKGDFINRGHKKVLNISYTPDFVGDGFIIECKGRANDSFPLRWKMFKNKIALSGIALYKPQTNKECDETVRLIKESMNGNN
jgi:hypothetical protein